MHILKYLLPSPVAPATCAEKRKREREREKKMKGGWREKAIISSLNVLMMHVKNCNRKADQKSKNILFVVAYTL